MAAAAPTVASIIKDLVALKKRVREIELALRKTAATLKIKLASLTDVKIAGAVDHQVLTYMDGEWVPGGGPTIPESPTPVTDAIDGASLSADLVGDDWPDDVGCRVTATLIIDGTFADVPIPADPYDRIYPYPYATFQLIDGGGPPASPPYTELASTAWHLNDGKERTIAWDFLPGTVPHVEVSMIADSSAYPGDATLTVVARITPLP